MAELFPIIDGHNDALMDYTPVGPHSVASFFERVPGRQLDYPRAQEGHLAAAFFAVFIPEAEADAMVHNFDPSVEYVLPALKYEYATQMTMAMIANLVRIERESGGKVAIARSVADIENGIREGVFQAILHFEGAEAIDADLHALEVYHQAGLRSLGLVWSRPTIFAEGVPFKFPHSPDTGPGLTDAGKALVKACNQLGIMVDLSHLNEKGFWDVAKISDAPLVATHSNAWNLCELPRNLTDKQLDAIRDSDGMVGVNFVVMLARADARNDADTPIETLVNHTNYLVEHLGIDHVGFGSDYGTATVPNELHDAGQFPKFVAALRAAGYDDEALNKLTHQNWLRVLRKTWKA